VTGFGTTRPDTNREGRCATLVLSRKLGDRIFIGDDITITVVDVGGGKVRLGVTAPKSTPILRHELLPWDDVRRTEPAPRPTGAKP
jgi:carbon storage regulator